MSFLKWNKICLPAYCYIQTYSDAYIGTYRPADIYSWLKLTRIGTLLLIITHTHNSYIPSGYVRLLFC